MAESSSGARDDSPHHRTVGISGAALPSAVSEVELQVPTSPVVPRSPARNRQLHWVGRLCSCFYPPPTETKPPISPPRPSKRLTLVLDLDETLIHSSPTACPDADFSIPSESQGQQSISYVRLRPGLAAFLQRISHLYEIVIYTASVESYARTIITQFDTNCLITMLFTREHCQKVEGVWVKDLNKIAKNLGNIVLVDVISS
jgi:Dullard-like phosphatase family protein